MIPGVDHQAPADAADAGLTQGLPSPKLCNAPRSARQLAKCARRQRQPASAWRRSTPRSAIMVRTADNSGPVHSMLTRARNRKKA